MTPSQKTKAIEDIYKKRKGKPKAFEKKYVVMKKFMGGKIKKGMKEKGKRLHLVDPRMRKDARSNPAMLMGGRRPAHGAGGGKRKGGGGKGKPRGGGGGKSKSNSKSSNGSGGKSKSSGGKSKSSGGSGGKGKSSGKGKK